ncbi:hypothetical protein Tco_1312709 [Tanacetum coccineum]
MRMEALQAREDLMKSIQNFLKKFNRISFRETPKELADFINTPNWNRHAFCNNNDDDDEEYTIAIKPVLPTEEPDNSLIMEDKHLDTIPETESDELIKSSVEDLVPIPCESEDSNDDATSIDDDSFSIEDIDYVDAPPPESELDNILREKLLNVNLLIAKIEALKDNPTPSSDFVTKYPSTSPNSFLEETNISYNSLPESETFCFNLPKAVNTASPHSAVVNVVRVNQANAIKASACWGKPLMDDKGFVDSGCSRHMTGNITYHSDFKEFDRGYVTFGGGAHSGRIFGKGTLKTDSLDFEDLPDESQLLLKIPRKDNMYSFDMKNIVPKESLTCLVAKATSDESML